VFALTKASHTKADHINFEQFAQWYGQVGYALIPWLELLDLRKWKMALSQQTQSQQQELGFGTRAAAAKPLGDLSGESSANGSKSATTTSTTSTSDAVVFEFDMRRFRLVFLRSDVDRLERMDAKTHFGQLKAEAIYRAFGQLKVQVSKGNSYITRADFDKAIRALIPGNSLEPADKAFLSVVLSSVFAAYDRNKEQRVPFVEFCAGFSVLCHGNKASKLSLAFDVFERSSSPQGAGNRGLGAAALQRFLLAFLTMLFALNDEKSSQPAAQTWASADLYTASVAAKVLGGRHSIVFADFAQWYTDGGHTVIPWLELLSLDKWKFTKTR
jgi:hypothetical protein